MNNPHFKSIEDAEQAAFYFLHDIEKNVKALMVLIEQYELENTFNEAERGLISNLLESVKCYDAASTS